MAIKDSLLPTGRKGIFYKEHPSRKHGVKKDRMLILRYTIGGKTRTESFGWLSKGLSEADAENKIRDFRVNYKSGSGPTSLADEKEILRQALQAEKEQRRKEEQTHLEEEKRNISLSKFFTTVYFPHAKAEKKPDTYGTEERLFRLWIKPVIGKLPFNEIAPFHLDKIKNNMRKGKRKDTYKNSKPRPLAPKTILHALALIRQVWNHARRDGLVTGDWPGKDVKKPKFDNRRVRFLTKDEADRLFTALFNVSKQLRDIALISLHCGLRAGEVFALTWDCVDLKNETMLLIDPKNTKTRTAFMSPDVLSMLAERKKKSTGRGLVFHNQKGKQINGVSAAFSRLVSRLGLNNGVTDPRRKVFFHSLRHTYASWLVEEGVPLYTVKELLGHETLAMTARYSHLGENALRDATRTLATALQAKKDEKIVSIK